MPHIKDKSFKKDTDSLASASMLEMKDQSLKTDARVLVSASMPQMKDQSSQTDTDLLVGVIPPQKTVMKAAIFQVSDYPPWYITLLCAMQQVMSNIGGPVAVAYIIQQNLCAPNNHILFAELVSTAIVMSGVATVLQVMFGVRLPIVQGSSFTYIPPVLAMMSSPRWSCPDISNSALNMSIEYNSTSYSQVDTSLDDLWRPRLMELSGSLAAASMTQVLHGCTGALGFFMTYIGPLTIIPTVGLVGLSLVSTSIEGAKHQWGITILVIVLVVIFGLVLGGTEVPCPAYSKQRGCYLIHYPFFRFFHYILALGIAWLVCYLLTVYDALPNDPGALGYMARTDAKLNVIRQSKWFFVPYPGRWGIPTVGAGVFVGMFAATITSVVESVGDYYITAQICGVPPPPSHAINRGIAMEGFASILSGLVGAAHATNSYSTVIGFIGVTGVRSRIIWIIFGFLMIGFGVIGKIGAALSIIPTPIIGGLTIVGLGMVLSIALSNISHLDMRSPRNLLILAISIMLGMVLPTWLRDNPGAIQTGFAELDQVLTVLLSTAMFVGGVVGFLLDNLTPGTKEERGLLSFKAGLTSADDLSHHSDSSQLIKATYDIPYISDKLRCYKWCSYVPFLPAYMDRPCRLNHCNKGGNREPDDLSLLNAHLRNAPPKECNEAHGISMM